VPGGGHERRSGRPEPPARPRRAAAGAVLAAGSGLVRPGGPGPGRRRSRPVDADSLVAAEPLPPRGPGRGRSPGSVRRAAPPRRGRRAGRGRAPDGREEVAPLLGTAWLKFLDDTARAVAFSTTGGAPIVEVVYDPTTADRLTTDQVAALFSRARLWIRHHDARSRC
jgi:hypothetical protein